MWVLSTSLLCGFRKVGLTHYIHPHAFPDMYLLSAPSHSTYNFREDATCDNFILAVGENSCPLNFSMNYPHFPIIETECPRYLLFCTV